MTAAMPEDEDLLPFAEQTDGDDDTLSGDPISWFFHEGVIDDYLTNEERRQDLARGWGTPTLWTRVRAWLTVTAVLLRIGGAFVAAIWLGAAT